MDAATRVVECAGLAGGGVAVAEPRQEAESAGNVMEEAARILEWTLARPTAGRRRSSPEAPGSGQSPAAAGTLPRITRLMALAIKFEEMIRVGVATDYADLARLGGVTRARMTQIMNLLNLAPDIQEEILFFPRTLAGRDPITERAVRQISGLAEWQGQRQLWERLRGTVE